MCLLSEPEEEREEDQGADLPAGRGQKEPREDAGQLHQRLFWRKSETQNPQVSYSSSSSGEQHKR